MQQFYVAIIEKARQGYGVFFPDLPGCTSFGATVSEAAKNAYVAAQAHAALTQEHGEKLPSARSTDEIADDPEVKEQARLLIPIEIGEEPVRVNISLPASALEALDRTAKELSLTRSGAIAHLAIAREAARGRFMHNETKSRETKVRGRRPTSTKRK
jgi:predicted RNase H-like HicB family nuclease